MKITEYQNVQVGVEPFETPQGKFWRFAIQDGPEIVVVNIPDAVARAIAQKISTGVHIEIADNIPGDGKLKLQ